MRRELIVALVGLCSVAVMSGCGEEDGRALDPRAESSTSGSVSPSLSGESSNPPDLSDPPITGQSKRSTTVQGLLSPGVEEGCVILEMDGKTLVLLGVRPQDAPLGDRVAVTGTLRPDLSTTCQQGTAFQVTTIKSIRG